MLMSRKDAFATTHRLHLPSYIVLDGQDGKPIRNIDLGSILPLLGLPRLSLTTPFYFLSATNTAGDGSISGADGWDAVSRTMVSQPALDR